MDYIFIWPGLGAEIGRVKKRGPVKGPHRQVFRLWPEGAFSARCLAGAAVVLIAQFAVF